MIQISQKQAVIDAVKFTLGTTFDPSKPAKDLLNKLQITAIVDHITGQIIGGMVAYSKDVKVYDEVHKYVRSMVHNHLTKSTELNGGIRYAPKSPSERSTKIKEPVDKRWSGIDKNVITPELKQAFEEYLTE